MLNASVAFTASTLTIEAHDGGIKYTSHGENAQEAPPAAWRRAAGSTTS
jgi:hypothetical protein